MPEIVKDTQLYHAVSDASRDSKRCWIASPYLGRDGHNVLDSSFLDAKDRRLLIDVRSGNVDRLEAEYLRTWAGKGKLQTLRRLHAKIYIFDSACIVTSANLSLGAFERNREIGVVFTGKAMKPVINLFSALWKDARAVKPSDIANLPKKRISGDGTGKEDDTQAAHTEVDAWDELSGPTVPLEPEEEEDAAPTFESDGPIAPPLREKIAAELKARGLQKCDFLTSDLGARDAKKSFRRSLMFDASYEHGTRRKTWKNGVWRSVNQVKAVFTVGSHVVVAFRVLKRYTVDSVLLRAAKKLRVYQGKPNGVQIREYLNRARKRAQKKT